MSLQFNRWKFYEYLNKFGGIIFLCALFGFIIYDSYNQTYELNYNARYIIGEAVDVVGKWRGKNLVYRYTVDGVEYQREENYQGGEVGKRYWIKFSSETPKYSDFLQDEPAPDTLRAVPKNGWEKLPEYIK